MLFNSFVFGFFLFAIYLLYWLGFNRKQVLRNGLLLAASYFFYCCWNWRFLPLIIGISAVDYLFGMWIDKSDNDKRRKWLLSAAITINLLTLGIFKYFNFFVESFYDLINLFSHNYHSISALNIILPVGISFFTFQGLSYVIDIYRRQIGPTRDVLAFFTFIAFFPQLVAGPIERAKNLLPQFTDKRQRIPFCYEDARRGLLLIAIGLFKKIVIADRIAIFVDAVYADPSAAHGWPAVMAALFFAFQLYIDFSAYSQIAIGTARILGYKLTTNFRSPYLATSFHDFWARWHITLTSWFRDYLYFPLGGSRKGRWRTYLNVMIIFAVSGLWHGASWNFVIWGCLNGLALVVFDKMLHLEPRQTASKILSCIAVVGFWTLTLIFFRAKSFADAIAMFGSLGFGGFESLTEFGLKNAEIVFSFAMIAVMMIAELLMKVRRDQIERLFYGKLALPRWAVYLALVLGTIFFGIYGPGNDAAFIYFQF